MRFRICLLLAVVVTLGACVFDEPGAVPTVVVEEPVSPEPWSEVDHPVVVAVRSSAAVDPSLNAIDGLLETSWVSGLNGPQWIEVDLGEPIEVSKIRLTVDQGSDGHSVHRIHAGAHDNPGRLADTLDGDTSNGDVLEAVIGYEVEFIRVLTTESPSWAAWAEIEIDVRG
jgi:hypothetical protein